MNKIKLIKKILIISIIFLTILLYGCGSKLKTPTNLNVDENEELTWNEVKGASKYGVLIYDGEEIIHELYTNENSLQLPNTLTNAIEYKIVVFAVKTKDTKSIYSEDSNPLVFTPNHVELFTYKLIEEETAYSISVLNPELVTGDITIPSEYEELPVTQLVDGAFKDCVNLTSVIVPDTITEISLECFKGCTNLKNVKLPKSVTLIRNHAFSYCTSLEEIVIPDNVTSIGTAFTGCTSLKTIKLSEKLEKIDSSCFYQCSSLTEIELPESLKQIGSSVFYECDALENLCIPKNVSSIGARNFCKCKKLNITVDQENQYYYMDSNCLIERSTNMIVCGSKDFTISPLAESIGVYAYSGLQIDELTLPSNIKELKYKAFDDCVIGKLITNVGLEEISNLLEPTKEGKIGTLILSSTVKTINFLLIEFKEKYDTIIMDENNPYFVMDQNCLIEKDTNTLVLAYDNCTIPNYVTTLGHFSLCYTDTEVITIPGSIKSISSNVLNNNSFVKKIVIEEGVEEIQKTAIGGCDNVTVVILPKSLKRIYYAGIAGLPNGRVLLNSRLEYLQDYGITQVTVFSTEEFNIFDSNGKRTITLSHTNIMFNCTFKDDYLYSTKVFHIYGEFSSDGGSYNVHWSSPLPTTILPLTYRDGYRFLGFSLEENSDEVDFPAKPHMYQSTYYYVFMNIEEVEALENDTILYAVYEKIE